MRYRLRKIWTTKSKLSCGKRQRKCPYRSDIRKRNLASQEDPMNPDALTTRVADGVAVITLGSAKPIYFDAEMGDALTEALDGFAGDARMRSYEEQKITSPSRSIEALQDLLVRMDASPSLRVVVF